VTSAGLLKFDCAHSRPENQVGERKALDEEVSTKFSQMTPFFARKSMWGKYDIGGITAD
jgi:hypothetical protein